MSIAPKSAYPVQYRTHSTTIKPPFFLGAGTNLKTRPFAPPPIKALPQGVLFQNGAASLVHSGEQVFLRLSGWTLAKVQMTSALRALMVSLAAGVTSALVAELAIIECKSKSFYCYCR